MKSIQMSPGNAVATGNGSKTQTRRTVRNVDKFLSHTYAEAVKLCPYKPGDRLYIREAFYAYGFWHDTGEVTKKTGKPKFKFIDITPLNATEVRYDYKYTDNPPETILKGRDAGQGWYKRPSMFMPEAASRYTIEVTNVRAEQLGDITEADAIAEGILSEEDGGEKLYYFYPCNDLRDDSYLSNPITSYYSLWTSINGPGSWNPELWVWVIEYKLVTPE